MRNMRAHQSTLDPFLKYEQNVSTPVKSQLPISTVNIFLKSLLDYGNEIVNSFL